MPPRRGCRQKYSGISGEPLVFWWRQGVLFSGMRMGYAVAETLQSSILAPISDGCYQGNERQVIKM